MGKWISKAIDPVQPTETDDYIHTRLLIHISIQDIHKHVLYGGQYLAPNRWQSCRVEECVDAPSIAAVAGYSTPYKVSKQMPNLVKHHPLLIHEETKSLNALAPRL